ncbi:hypothetical protein GDO81_025896, partial [Engystomops pustulosus]
ALVAGLVIHSFIIGVNVSDWWRGRSVTPVDLIVTSLGFSRMCSQASLTLYLIVVKFLMNNYKSNVILLVIDTVYHFFTCTNIWLTSLLSIVLYLKISNLHTRLFLYLRRMISHKTGRLIVASGVCSTLNTLFSFYLTFSEITNGATYNTTIRNPFQDCIYIYYIFTLTTATSLPLLFCCTSSVLLFVSLYHHTTRMKMSSNLSINLETYYSAMRFISFTFFYNIIYYAVHFAWGLYYYFYCVELTWLYIFMGFLPALHSSYLIYKTAKLRSQMSKVLQGVMN